MAIILFLVFAKHTVMKYDLKLFCPKACNRRITEKLYYSYKNIQGYIYYRYTEEKHVKIIIVSSHYVKMIKYLIKITK